MDLDLKESSLRERLDKLGIYQLRIYARKMGVDHATTLKKEVLIEEIIKVVSGEKAPHIRTTKKGRPPKEIVQLTAPELGNPTALSVLPSPAYTYGFAGIATIASTVASSKLGSDARDIVGLVDVFQNGSGIVVPICEGVPYAYITDELVKKNNIKRGDLITAEAYELETAEEGAFPTTICKIKTVNGYELDSSVDREPVAKVAEDSKPMPVSTEDSVLAKIYQTSDVTINLGDRVLITGKDRQVLPFTAYNLASVASTSNDVQVIAILLNSNQDYVDAYRKLPNTICISSNFSEDREKQFKMFELGIDYARSMAKYNGKNVLCILPDVDDILSLCGDAVEYDRCASMLKNLYKNACAYDISSLSVVMGVTETHKIYNDLITNENLYIKACDISIARQLRYKVDWQGSYRNQLGGDLQGINEDSFRCLSFLRRGDRFDRQKDLEDWICAGVSAEVIKERMKNI